MILRCPSCGREGNLPDHLGASARFVRCRRCKARFSTGDVRNAAAFQHTSNAITENMAASPRVRNLALMSPNGFSSESEDEMTEMSAPTPFDSQYEMTAVLGGDPDDSQTELPAFGDESDISGEMEAGRPFETSSSEFLLPVPWYFNFIDSWGRLHFYVATGFAGASLAVLGFLLVRALVAGRTMSSSVTALIIGCVGTIAFLLISLSATALTVLLVDLARNVRMLIQQADRNTVGPISAKNQDRTRLSQPVG
jgi:zinc-ribbon domain